MDVVLIGASDRSLLWRKGKIKQEEYTKFVEEYGVLLAKHAQNVIVTPDDGVYMDIAQSFTITCSRKAVAYYPDQDTLLFFNE